MHASYRNRGGEDFVVDDERAMLAAAGHDVHQHIVVNPSGLAETSRALATSVWNRRAGNEIGSLVSSLRPDIAHVHNTWFALSPSVVAALQEQGIPVVVTLHNFRLMCANAVLFRDGHLCEDCVGRSPVPAVVHRCYKGSVVLSSTVALSIAVHRRLGTWARYVDRFIVMSEAARAKMIVGGIPAEKLVVRENFARDPGERPAPPSASRSVVFVGRLSPEKGVDVLLDAWREAQLTDLELVVIGDGPLRTQLESMDVTGVRFVGAQSPSRVAEHMLSARSLVFPSGWPEVGPRVPLEAFAAGLPVLASDCVAIASVIERAGAGSSFGMGSRSDLVRALGSLEDAGYVDSAGRAARQLFTDRFNPTRAIAGLEAIYRGAFAARNEGHESPRQS